MTLLQRVVGPLARALVAHKQATLLASFGHEMVFRPGEDRREPFAVTLGWTVGGAMGLGPRLPSFRDLVLRHSYLLLRGFDLDRAGFERIALGLGQPLDDRFTNEGMALQQDGLLQPGARARFVASMCLDAPEATGGGETLLTNNRAFLHTAPAPLLDRLRRSTVSYHPLSRAWPRNGSAGAAPLQHRAVMKHPLLDEEVLFLGIDARQDPHRNYASQFCDMSPEESASLMRELDAALRRPDIIHTHRWRRGDVLIRDNFLTCHARGPVRGRQPPEIIHVALA